MNKTTAFSTLEWGKTDLTKYPKMVTAAPGPQSKHWHDRCTKYFKGLSGQVKLFPVTFESGEGCILRDVDGNEYIDFCLLYTSPSPRDRQKSRMPSSA